MTDEHGEHCDRCRAFPDLWAAAERAATSVDAALDSGPGEAAAMMVEAVGDLEEVLTTGPRP